MNDFNESNCQFKAAMEGDDRFKQFGNNGLLVFALVLYTRAENPEEFAAESLTDGSDDKKVDACHIDYDEHRAVVAQGYCSETWGKSAAPANKASDLNTAISWLLAVPENEIPDRIQAKARELREAVLGGEVDRIDIVYAHNCYESENVMNELRAVATAAKSQLVAMGAGAVSVVVAELGLNGIEDQYRSRDRDILVEDTMEVPGTVLQEQEAEDWKAIVVTVDGAWIHDLYASHGNRLFSANLRDFLGITKRFMDINAGIKQTAASEPTNFWVYNNGITALTHEIIKEGDSVSIRGISIINGAQTTGALGECRRDEAEQVEVLCRIVQCDKPEVVHRVVRYNNTQNVIRPSDLRSNDAIQKRLLDEFKNIGLSYVHRRSGPKAPRNAISAEPTGVALCAFHGDIQTAARNRRDIFLTDAVYERVFRSNLSAEHVYLVNALSSAFDALKLRLQKKVSQKAATDLEGKQYDVLRFSMSRHFILFLVGFVAEELLKARLADKYTWKALRKMITPDGQQMRDCWMEALQTILPSVAQFVRKEGEPYDVTRSTAMTTSVGESLKAHLAAMETDLGKRFASLRDSTTFE
jgi:hypothetical protein